jgi:hypothetical protein
MSIVISLEEVRFEFLVGHLATIPRRPVSMKYNPPIPRESS